MLDINMKSGLIDQEQFVGKSIAEMISMIEENPSQAEEIVALPIVKKMISTQATPQELMQLMTMHEYLNAKTLSAFQTKLANETEIKPLFDFLISLLEEERSQPEASHQKRMTLGYLLRSAVMQKKIMMEMDIDSLIALVNSWPLVLKDLTPSLPQLHDRLATEADINGLFTFLESRLKSDALGGIDPAHTRCAANLFKLPSIQQKILTEMDTASLVKLMDTTGIDFLLPDKKFLTDIQSRIINEATSDQLVKLLMARTRFANELAKLPEIQEKVTQIFSGDQLIKVLQRSTRAAEILAGIPALQEKIAKQASSDTLKCLLTRHTGSGFFTSIPSAWVLEEAPAIQARLEREGQERFNTMREPTFYASARAGKQELKQEQKVAKLLPMGAQRTFRREGQ